MRAGAHLYEVDFTGSSLSGADFGYADVRKVKFSFCDLAGANFEGAEGLETAYFDDARNLNKAMFPANFDPNMP